MVLTNRFNTAGGRCCCNKTAELLETHIISGDVSIPQAVGVVATEDILIREA